MSRTPAAIRSLRPAEWPPADQRAWDAACRKPQGLKRGGKAAHMKQVTRDDLARRYGLFLDHVARTIGLDSGTSAAALVTPDRVEGYIAELRARVGSVTLYGTISKLRRMAELLAPSVDFAWLREIEQELEWDMRPASKQHRIVDSDRIVKAGLTLMRDADTNDKLSSFRRSLQYRNGLMIAFLAFLPIRLKNFAALKIGSTLVQVEGQWQVTLPARETKSGRAEQRQVPNLLQSCLTRYIESYRRPLRSEEKGLWLSGTDQPLTYHGCERIITETTRKSLGVPISPHLFRVCAVSMAYLYAGDQPHLAAGILQHTDPSVTEAHYNRARGASFGRAFSELVERQLKSH
jgi:integrase